MGHGYTWALVRYSAGTGLRCQIGFKRAPEHSWVKGCFLESRDIPGSSGILCVWTQMRPRRVKDVYVGGSIVRLVNLPCLGGVLYITQPNGCW